jgi:hypothetical protein
MKLTDQSKQILWGSVLACLGALGIYSGLDPGRGLPREAQLRQAVGTATWYQPYKYGVRFGLSGHPNGFDYLSKGNAANQVADAIGAASGKTVRVLYDPGSLGAPIYSKDKYFTVFSVTVGEQPVRSYDQVAAAWRSDNQVGYWIGWVAVAVGAGIALHAWRSRSAA